MKVFNMNLSLFTETFCHVNSKQLAKKNKLVEYLAWMLHYLNKLQVTFSNVHHQPILTKQQRNTRELSCYWIRYVQTIAEDLILPGAVEMMEIFIGEKEASFSNIIERRISNMGEDTQTFFKISKN